MFAKDLPQHVHGLARRMAGSPILLKPHFLPVFNSELLYFGQGWQKAGMNSFYAGQWQKLVKTGKNLKHIAYTHTHTHTYTCKRLLAGTMTYHRLTGTR